MCFPSREHISLGICVRENSRSSRLFVRFFCPMLFSDLLSVFFLRVFFFSARFFGPILLSNFFSDILSDCLFVFLSAFLSDHILVPPLKSPNIGILVFSCTNRSITQTCLQIEFKMFPERKLKMLFVFGGKASN